MKIAIVMWYNYTIKDYGDMAYKINSYYALMNNYKIFKFDKRECPTKKPHYEKLFAVQNILKNFDYVAWIDADAHFYVDSPKLEKLIEPHIDKAFIFSGDNAFHHSIANINTGFFIVKNNEYANDFLTLWKNSNSNHLVDYYFEQGELLYLYQNNINDINNNSIIIPYGVIQNFDVKHNINLKYYNKYAVKNKPYIIHYAGKCATFRKKHIYEYIIENSNYF